VIAHMCTAAQVAALHSLLARQVPPDRRIAASVDDRRPKPPLCVGDPRLRLGPSSCSASQRTAAVAQRLGLWRIRQARCDCPLRPGRQGQPDQDRMPNRCERREETFATGWPSRPRFEESGSSPKSPASLSYNSS
jgi:hypothetical protein